MDFFPTLPTRLRLLRETLGYSRQQLANRSLGPRAAANNIGRLERGVHNATPETLEKIAAGLGITLHFLAYGYERHTDQPAVGVDEGFPARLESLAFQRGLSLQDVAEKMGHKDATVLHLLRRGKVAPRREIIRRLALVLGCKTELLMTGGVSPAAATQALAA